MLCGMIKIDMRNISTKIGSILKLFVVYIINFSIFIHIVQLITLFKQEN